MADFFDRFAGGSGGLLSHTADSGDTWGPTGATSVSIASGSAYLSGSFVEGSIPFTTWTPPGTDYAATIVVGADVASMAVSEYGVVVRASGAVTAQSYYALDLYTSGGFLLLQYTTGGGVIQIGTTQSVVPVANDTLTLEVAGAGATVTLTVLHNGAQIYQTTDSTSTRITGAGSVGLRIPGSTGGHTDVVRTLWAGAIGGPSESISPSTALLAFSATQTFSAGGTLPVSSPTETISWSAGTGTVDSTGHYTAPSSGSSDTVTWASFDLPGHTATATVTLMGGSTPGHHRFRKGPSPKRKPVAKRLDFPIRATRSRTSG